MTGVSCMLALPLIHSCNVDNFTSTNNTINRMLLTPPTSMYFLQARTFPARLCTQAQAGRRCKRQSACAAAQAALRGSTGQALPAASQGQQLCTRQVETHVRQAAGTAVCSSE